MAIVAGVVEFGIKGSYLPLGRERKLPARLNIASAANRQDPDLA